MSFSRKCEPDEPDTPVGSIPDPCTPPDGEIIVGTPPNPED